MIRLGDVVGSVLREMAAARVQAALYAAEMAADFREHEVLRELPVPLYGVGAAEVRLPVAVARVSPDDLPRPVELDPDELAQAAGRVGGALPEERALAKAFAVYDDQGRHWRREVVPEVAKRISVDEARSWGIDGVAAVYGQFAGNRYLVDLAQRARQVTRATLQEVIGARHPERVADTASRLLVAELERLTDGGDGDLPAGLYVDVEAEALEGRDRVSTLTLQLDQGGLERTMLSDEQEGPT